MKKLNALALFATLALSAGLMAQSQQTVTGTVTDAMCGKAHGMDGKSPADCTRACIKAGSDYALASGEKVYTLKGDKTQFDKYAGQAVTVKGKVDGKVLTVDSIAAAKS